MDPLIIKTVIVKYYFPGKLIFFFKQPIVKTRKMFPFEDGKALKLFQNVLLILNNDSLLVHEGASLIF